MTILFVISLFIIALGVALITRANLGTSPAACPPYVLSLAPGAPDDYGNIHVLYAGDVCSCTDSYFTATV